MSTPDSFTYGAEVVGGASPTHNTEVLSHYMFTTNEDDAQFVARFAVRVTPSGTATTDWTNLATACQAVEAALRKRYSKLTINWGAINQETFDPDVNAGTAPSSGFDQEPNLRKLTKEEFPNSGNARGYEFRVSLSQYPNYTDAFGPANGRRQVDVTMHYDVNGRLVVSMRGVWTQVPTALARAQFLSAFDGASGYAAYRLSKINATEPGASAYTWTVTNRDESDPNSLSTLTFSRTYEQHVNGRRGSTIDVAFSDIGGRVVTIRGTYYRTVSGAGGAYGNVFGTAGSSLTNYGAASTGGIPYATTQLAGLTAAQGGALSTAQNAKLIRDPLIVTNEQDDRTDYTLVYREMYSRLSIDIMEQGLRIITIEGTYWRSLGTTPAAGAIWGNVYGATAQGSRANYADGTAGALAWAVTQLANLTAGQGGALIPGQTCELIREPLLATDDLDDRTDYRLIYRELLQKQSNATNYLDDPNIIADSMAFATFFTAVEDSPPPAGAQSTPGPNGSQVSGVGGQGGGGGGNGLAAGQTGSRQPVSPGTATGATTAGAGGSSPVSKPVLVRVQYSAFLAKTVTNLAGYWKSNVFPLLLETLDKAFPGGVDVVGEYDTQGFTCDTTTNRISADMALKAYQSNVILFKFTLGLFNDYGVRVDAAFTGTPHEYLVQQALPKSTMARKVEAVYITGSYSLDQFKTAPALQGWVLLSDATPATVDKVMGIPDQGVQQQSLTYAVLEENLVWVARNVGQASAGAAPSAPGRNITYTPSGSSGGGPIADPAVASGAVDAFGHGI